MRFLLALLTLLAGPAFAQSVTDPAQIALVCAYNTAIPAPTSGQYAFVQCDSTGKLITSGSGTPGGSNGQIQYNNAGAFGGTPTGTGVLTALGNATNAANGLVALDASGNLALQKGLATGTGFVFYGPSNTDNVPANTSATTGGNTTFNVLGLPSLTSGYHNSFFGYSAGQGITSGYQNYGGGYFALQLVTTGYQNTAVGNGACDGVTSGYRNVCIGHHTISSSGATVSTDFDNVAIGSLTFDLLSGGGAANHNTGIGSQVAANHQVTGNDNTLIGYASAYNLTSGIANNCEGSQSCYSITSGSYNTAVGYNSLTAVTTGQLNVAMGYNAGQNWTGSQNIGIGAYAIRNTTGSNNIGIGYLVETANTANSNQLVIGNFIYGTGLSGTGATISSGAIGFGVKAPAQAVDVLGNVQVSGGYYVAGTAGVSCAAGTVNLATFQVTNGIVTHC